MNMDRVPEETPAEIMHLQQGLPLTEAGLASFDQGGLVPAQLEAAGAVAEAERELPDIGFLPAIIRRLALISRMRKRQDYLDKYQQEREAGLPERQLRRPSGPEEEAPVLSSAEIEKIRQYAAAEIKVNKRLYRLVGTGFLGLCGVLALSVVIAGPKRLPEEVKEPLGIPDLPGVIDLLPEESSEKPATNTPATPTPTQRSSEPKKPEVAQTLSPPAPALPGPADIPTVAPPSGVVVLTTSQKPPPSPTPGPVRPTPSEVTPTPDPTPIVEPEPSSEAPTPGPTPERPRGEEEAPNEATPASAPPTSELTQG